MVSLFCLMVSLSAVDGNSSVSQRWLGISLYHPSSTGSHCRFSEAFHYPQPAMYKSEMQRDVCVCVCVHAKE